MAKRFEKDEIENSGVETRSIENGLSEKDFESDKISDIARKAGRAAIFALVFILPLFVLPFTVSPLELHKQFLAGILLLVSLVAYLIVTVQTHSFSYPKSVLNWGVTSVLLAALFSSIFSSARSASVIGEFGDPATLVSFLIYGLAYFLGAVFVKKEDIALIAKLFFGGLALTGAFAILQAFGAFILPWDFARQVSFNTVGSISGLAVLLAAGICMLSVAPFYKMKSKHKILFALLGILCFVFLMLVNYRILWLLIAFFVMFLAAVRFTDEKRVGLTLAIASIALFMALIAPQLPRFANIPQEVRPSLTATLQIVKSSFAWQRTITGTGLGTFGYEYNLHKPVSINETPFWGVRFSQGYNFFATSIVTTGLLGVLALLYLAALVARQIFKTSANEKNSVIAAGILFLVLQWFFYPSFLIQMFFVFFGLGALAALYGEVQEIRLTRLSRVPLFGFTLLIILLVASSLSGFYLFCQKYAGAVRYARAAKAFSAGDASGALQNADVAIRYDGARPEYWRLASQAVLAQTIQLASQGGTSDLQIAIQNGIGSTINFAMRAKDLNPRDSLNWLNLADIYGNLIGSAQGAENAARDTYFEAMRLDSANPDLHVALARALTNVPDGAGFAEAKEELQKAIALKPDYAAPHFLLVQLYIREGRVGQAIQKAEEIKSANPFDSGLAFQLGLLYYQSGEFGEAQKEFERAAGLNPNYSNARYFLGLIYDRNGDKNSAIAQFEKIEVFNPENGEVKRILENLRSGRPALSDIAPPGTPPEARNETPVSE